MNRWGAISHYGSGSHDAKWGQRRRRRPLVGRGTRPTKKVRVALKERAQSVKNGRGGGMREPAGSEKNFLSSTFFGTVCRTVCSCTVCGIPDCMGFDNSYAQNLLVYWFCSRFSVPVVVVACVVCLQGSLSFEPL